MSSGITIIAEIGHNHCGSMQVAKDLAYAAKENGADIAKFQLYDTDKIKKPSDTNYNELKFAELTKENMHDLYEYCNSIGIEFGASVFDKTRLEWTDEIDLKRYKIASRTALDSDFLELVHKRGKPMIISCNPYLFSDSKFPYEKDPSVTKLFVLSKRDIQVYGVRIFPEQFNSTLGFNGLSDHTVGMDLCRLAIDRGANMIEKHITFNKNWPGWDQSGSMLPDELKAIRQYATIVEYIRNDRVIA